MAEEKKQVVLDMKVLNDRKKEIEDVLPRLRLKKKMNETALIYIENAIKNKSSVRVNVPFIYMKDEDYIALENEAFKLDVEHELKTVEDELKRMTDALQQIKKHIRNKGIVKDESEKNE